MDNEVYMKILAHIEDYLGHYPERGTPDDKRDFFSGLDTSYQQPWIVDPILESIYMTNLVLTGSFGHYVIRRLAALKLKKDYILFNGHIRDGEPPKELASHFCGRNVEEEPLLQPWLLFDDSNYSGRTRFVLETFMRQNHSFPITSTVVIYNGAPNFNPQINSLYSWHMMHGLSVYETAEELTEEGSAMIEKSLESLRKKPLKPFRPEVRT
jgi:hypothetical protein